MTQKRSYKSKTYEKNKKKINEINKHKNQGKMLPKEHKQIWHNSKTKEGEKTKKQEQRKRKKNQNYKNTL